MTVQIALCALTIFLRWLPQAGAVPPDYFQIAVLDADTARGVPLAELETVNHLRFVTDSAGLVAIREPDLENTQVFFHVHAPGYEDPKDKQGFAGVPVEVKGGRLQAIRLKRTDLAERLYRVTGTGIYRDSVLLGEKPPIAEPLGNGAIAGIDSILATVFRGRVYWFGGDTLRLRHPVGQYWSSGATSELPGSGGLDPAKGVDLHYLVDDEGFARPMWPRNADVSTWTDGLLTAKDEKGQEQMVAHYAAMKSAGEAQEHGTGVFDADKNVFAPKRTLPPTESWRFPAGHPTPGRGGDDGYWLMPAPMLELAPFLAVRVKATVAAVTDPEQYEAFTCLVPGTNNVERDDAGNVVYGWKRGSFPVSPKNERALIATGALTEAEALYQPHDLATGKLVELRSGSVYWNEYRKKWIMIAEQLGPQGFTGEIYYLECATPVGPWHEARKIASHAPYSFYSPAQLPFFDQRGGRIIYFEGTFLSPTGSAQVARYDFNQLMYRLDLSRVAGKEIESKTSK